LEAQMTHINLHRLASQASPSEVRPNLYGVD